MKDQELDQLFRESVSEFQVTPSDEAWSKIAQQLQPKKLAFSFWIPAVAATILLFALAIGVWFDGNDQVTHYSAVLNYPEKPIQSQVTWTKKVEESKQQKVELKSSRQTIELSVPGKIENEINTETVGFQYATIGPIRKILPVAELDFKLKNPMPWKPETAQTNNTIKIKYIAGATLGSEAASKNKIGKLIAYAQQTTPADWMGELRDAKDDLLKNRVTLNY